MIVTVNMSSDVSSSFAMTIVVLPFGDHQVCHVNPHIWHGFDVEEHVDGRFVLFLVVLAVFIDLESRHATTRGATSSSFSASTVLDGTFGVFPVLDLVTGVPSSRTLTHPMSVAKRSRTDDPSCRLHYCTSNREWSRMKFSRSHR